MTRSRRKTPVIGITTAVSDKPYKVDEHRRERSAVRQHLKSTQDDVGIKHGKAYGNPWSSCKDGKQWLCKEPGRERWLRK